MTTVCNAPHCDRELPPTKGSRPRQYCNSSCRRAAHDARKAEVAASPASVPTVPPEPPLSDLAGAVRGELELADRLNTVPGQLALAVARRIDSSGTTASSVATLSKELRALLAEALADVKRPGNEDAVDQAKAVRDRKLRAVG